MIGTGTTLPDGRNQTLLATGLTPGAVYYVEVTTANNNAGEYFAGITPLQTPVVTTSPGNQTVVAGQPATFTAVAAGSSPLTVQWQVSTNGATYTAISGATSTTFTIAATSAAQTNYLYEAVFSNVAGMATTVPALLTVQTPPVFTSGPPLASIIAGQTYNFTFAANGSPVPTLSASNLPSWLTFNPVTGGLTGTPTLATTYTNLMITATNAAGSVTTTFSLTVIAAALDHLAVTTMPTSIMAGGVFLLQVTAQDRYNNPILTNGDTVSFTSLDPLVPVPAAPIALTGGVGVTLGTLETANPAGLAITAHDQTSPGINGSSLPVIVTPAAASQLAFGGQPTNTVAGVAVSPAVTVKIEDTFGNVETADNASSLSIAIASGPAGATILSGSTATVTAGVAIFSTLKLTTAGSYTLQASDAPSALTSLPSNSFVISPKVASAYQLTATTTTLQAGNADVLTIALVDQYQNVESGFSGTKTLTFAGLGTAASGAVPTVTDNTSTAINEGTSTTITFTNGISTLGGTLVPYKTETATLTASDGTLTTSGTGGTSVTLTVSPAVASTTVSRPPRRRRRRELRMCSPSSW